MSTRETYILNRLDRDRVCSYEDLGRDLGVSTMTVRRTVDRLVQRGLAFKTIGGVRKVESPPGPPGLYETAVLSRFNAQRAEKRAIAALAATLSPSGSDSPSGGGTVFLDGSTTCLELARAISTGGSTDLTVVTYSALTCLELGQARHKVIAIGGQYDAASLCMTGSTAEEQVERFFVDVAFISTKGFVAAEGTFESSEHVFRIKQIIAQRRRRLVLLVDHTKFGQRALCRVLETAQIHDVVTDDKAPRGDLKRLKARGIRVHIAAAQGDRALAS